MNLELIAVNIFARTNVVAIAIKQAAYILWLAAKGPAQYAAEIFHSK